MKLLHNLYTRVLHWAALPNASKYLSLVAFAESSFFPIPPDVMLVPMIIAKRERAWRYAAIATIASVLGGLLGYLIGAVFFEQIGQPILSALGKADQVMAFNDRFNTYGIWVVLIAGLTPFPFKVITIMSGFTGLPLPAFILSAIVARAARFYIVSALLWMFGAPIRGFIEKRLGLTFAAFIVVLIGGFYAVRFL